MKAHKAKMQGNEGPEGCQNDLRQGTGAFPSPGALYK